MMPFYVLILKIVSIGLKLIFVQNLVPKLLVYLIINVIGLSLTWESISDKSYFKSVRLVNIKSVKILEKRFDQLI
jgi:hypothetical protein